MTRWKEKNEINGGASKWRVIMWQGSRWVNEKRTEEKWWGYANIWYLHVVNQLLRAGHIAADGAKALGKGAHHDIDIGRVHALERTRRDEPSISCSVEYQ